jgi:DHA3 family macrolide efflux protein-like MFS transporter
MGKLGLLKPGAFLYFFLASLIGVLGEGIFGLTVIVLVLEQTGSTYEVGKMLVLTLLPSILLAPFAGVFIDRLNKKHIAIFSNTIRFLAIILIPASYYLGFFNSYIFSFSILISYVAWYIVEPAKDSILKQIVKEDQLEVGVSLIQGAWQVGLLSSAIIAGAIIDFYGAYIGILISSLCYVLAVCFFLLLKLPKSKSKQSDSYSFVGGFFHEFKDGWRYLYKNKKALYLVLATSMILPFFYAINALIVPFNYKILEGNGLSLGIIDSGAGIGSFIAAIFCMVITNKARRLALIVSIFLLAVATSIFSITSTIFYAFIFYTLIGFLVGNFKVLSRTYVYEYVDVTYIGRVMTAITLLSLFLAMIVSLGIAYLADYSIFFSYLAVSILIVTPVVFVIIGTRGMIEYETQFGRNINVIEVKNS